ncbi:hypothetical protein ACKX2L_06005 [Lachnospiraceae bacterium YH-ros2228]|jgi:hypothetical protein
MQYRIFKRSLHKNWKTDWEDTGDVIESERGRAAITKWIAKWIDECPKAYAPGKITYGENRCWMEVKNRNTDHLLDDGFFMMELAVRVA